MLKVKSTEKIKEIFSKPDSLIKGRNLWKEKILGVASLEVEDSEADMSDVEESD